MQLANKTNVKIRCLSFRSPISDPNPISRKSLLIYSLYLGLTCIVGIASGIYVRIYLGTEGCILGEDHTCEQAVFAHLRPRLTDEK